MSIVLEHDKGILNQQATEDDIGADVATIRPKTLGDYIGQEKIKRNLQVFLQAARGRQEAIDHLLLSGPPGLGKTTLANIMAHEMGVRLHTTSGPALERAGDLAAILTNLEPKDILFVDEIHRLNRVVEETLYPAMEDNKIDVVIGQGPSARIMRLDVAPFTLVGATTRSGLLSQPLRDRFGIHFHLEFYQVKELEEIVVRAGRILNMQLRPEGAFEIARRSRGTPRIATRLLRRIRDFAEVDGSGLVDLKIAQSALTSLAVDECGFDAMDRKILLTIIDHYDGGPVGLDTLAATLGEERDTLEEVYEPFLIQEGYLHRTPKGRLATPLAYDHFQKPKPAKVSQGSLPL